MERFPVERKMQPKDIPDLRELYQYTGSPCLLRKVGRRGWDRWDGFWKILIHLQTQCLNLAKSRFNFFSCAVTIHGIQGKRGLDQALFSARISSLCSHPQGAQMAPNLPISSINPFCTGANSTEHKEATKCFQYHRPLGYIAKAMDAAGRRQTDQGAPLWGINQQHAWEMEAERP